MPFILQPLHRPSPNKIEQLSDYISQIIPEYREFLRLHNDGHYPDQIQTNLQWCVKAFNKRKI
ncbi:MAG: hypothetical protein IPK94_06175 [Saprospiraceae bacterium]|nr:hypothetical protein [Saprospiraceae bacterium]